MHGVTREPYGITRKGDEVSRFTLTNRHGARVCVLDWGATISELHVPDREGRLADVVLGFDTLAEYEINAPHFGSTIGRVANRIAGGRFALDGVEYRLHVNNGPNHLHGGEQGFGMRLWKAETLTHADGPAIRLEHVSPDGDEGYPGRLDVRVTMVFDDDHRLAIDYEARTDAATPVNLTNHSYFNLAGQGDILGHLLELHADRFTEVDADLIPTGRLRPVAGGAFDFNAAKPIGVDLAEVEGGYDHNFVLGRAVSEGGAPAATLVEPVSGRRMTMHTDQPGVQLYTGNFLDGVRGKHGAVHHRHAALCLEAQHFPDALHQPGFPTVVLRPGEVYRQHTSYRFDALRPGEHDGAHPAR